MKNSIKQKIYNKLPEGKRDKIVKVYHVLRTIKNVFCWVLIAVLTVTVIALFVVRTRGETPSVFGYTFQRVQTGSMVPELEVGDVILGKNIDDVSSLEVGDIITFKGNSTFNYNHVTHRIVEKPHLNDKNELVLRTKGDANEVSDPEISADSVESIMVRKLGFLKALYTFFLSPWGLLVFIFLIVLVFFDEILNIGRVITGNYDDEEKVDIGEIIERVQREEEQKKLDEKARAHRRAVKSAKSSPKHFVRKRPAEKRSEPQDE